MITFEELCVFALARLPDQLRRLRVPAADVGDVVHDVVLVAHPKLDRFQPRRLGSEEEVDVARALLAWLGEIARRRVMRHRTKASSRLEVWVGDVAELEGAGAGSLGPEELADRAQRRGRALGVLGNIRPERAEVLVLHDIGDFSLPEIAGRQRVKLNTAKSRLNRARQDVRVVVEQMRQPPVVRRRETR
jgi:RNA polymerase sigma factor (sigma-70 family)